MNSTTAELPKELLKHYWGYDDFLPLQAQAVSASLAGRDSLVVLPTGGGKSLCYQLPALIRDGLTVVVSPLISLMKDQVDSLQQIGIKAAALNSALAASEQQRIHAEINQGSLKLLYLAPERLLTESTLQLLVDSAVTCVAIDEAHCISSWGHDFRPEYRALKTLRKRLPSAALHAYTATATPQVRDDIVAQLSLQDPEILIGNFHRRNLVYQVRRRQSGLNQIADVIERYRDAAGIVYAISRSKVEQISETLNRLGYRTLPYHAGLTDAQRIENQNALINDQIQAIVATVAFGMGIDKSNVRYVVHAEMPKSIEAYQQESGRAGRDGLESECWLLYSAADAQIWQKIISGSDSESQNRSQVALKLMQDYCSGTSCRHDQLVRHFGQQLDAPCQACDICLGQLDTVDNPTELAQKILSCVFRCKENFGAAHVAKVLCGSRDKQVLKFGHEKLSTWGLLQQESLSQCRDWIDQLIQQNFIHRSGEFSVLKISDLGWKLIHREVEPELLRTPQPRAKVTPSKIFDSWEGVERSLFEELRVLRRDLAQAANVPAYVVFSDATLRDLARRRPVTNSVLIQVHGIGVNKSQQYGDVVMQTIRTYCDNHTLDTDVAVSTAKKVSRPTSPEQVSAGARQSFKLFDERKSIEQVCQELERAPSTVWGYLEDYIYVNKVFDPTEWVDSADIGPVEMAASYSDSGRLKPIFDALHGRVAYETIRIIVACRNNRELGSAGISGPADDC